MRITELKIKNYGRIDKFDFGLDRISIIETLYVEEISSALSELIYSDYIRPNLPKIETNNDSVISCVMETKSKKVKISISFLNGQPIKKYYIDNVELEDVDKLSILNGSLEQEMTSLFLNHYQFENSKNLLFYIDYKNYFAYYKGSIDKKLPSSEFYIFYSEKYFRFLLNNYIRNFKPIWINKDKGIYLSLLNSGEFESYKDYNGKPKKYYLSKTEKTIFDFIIFLEIGKFWEGLNRIRDLNSESKPLIALNLLEKVDKQFDALDYIKKIKQDRQIILLKEKK